eukprot:TRINITY_DN13315_c0_g1_i1.p1 TRINITY_DN13315_c0_g1~~TRINITY_DN13315_c0_g1_i1.p1  ORF type:complete len:597 (+),score=171.26 TRINITY_DN13315_c0_g1_i1:77-1867(+)
MLEAPQPGGYGACTAASGARQDAALPGSSSAADMPPRRRPGLQRHAGMAAAAFAGAALVAVALVRGAAPPLLGSQRLHIDQHLIPAGAGGLTTKGAAKICHGWCGDQETEFGLHCQFRGIDRLRAAMQDENCGTARTGLRNADLVDHKLSMLANSSAFKFFRGAVAYFDYNMKCWNPELFAMSQGKYPYVTSNGDCHPENYGIMELANGKLVWGVNDFDQAFATPFSWDVMRCVTGFILACKERRFEDHRCHKIGQAFIDGYIGMFSRPGCAMFNNDRFVEDSAALQHPNATMIAQLVEKSRRMSMPNLTDQWLQKYVDVDTLKFRTAKKSLTPLMTHDIAYFQRLVVRYLYNGVPALVKHSYNDTPSSFWRVLDVAYKTGSGTGSIGLDRYLILLQGGGVPHGMRILEMKQESASALQRYFRSGITEMQQGKRTADAARGAASYANIFYGWVNAEEKSYIIRQKSKYKSSVDITKLSASEMENFARNAGSAHAQYHLRLGCRTPECPLDESVAGDLDICQAVNTWLQGNPQFRFSTMQFAGAEARRQITAHQLYKRAINTHFQERPLDFLNVPDGHASLQAGFSCSPTSSDSRYY